VTATLAVAVKTIDNLSMTRPTLELTRCAAIMAISAAAFPLATATASAAPVGTNGGTTVPLRSILRACDFSPLQWVGGQNSAAATSVIRSAGGTVTAEVHLSEPTSPGTHFDVRLIQAPRASSSPCGSASPGVAVGGLDTDGAGQATTTLQDSIQSGTTGVWVFIQSPSPFSQTPTEFYTSDFVAPV
jgi:hypothetical protein